MSAPTAALTWVTTAEIAAALDVSTDLVTKTWIKDEGMPHFRVGRVLRFDPAAVDAWMRSRSIGETATAPPLRSVS